MGSRGACTGGGLALAGSKPFRCCCPAQAPAPSTLALTELPTNPPHDALLSFVALGLGTAAAAEAAAGDAAAADDDAAATSARQAEHPH